MQREAHNIVRQAGQTTIDFFCRKLPFSVSD